MDPLVPPMHAETGYEADDSAPELRISGFLCLLFGALSFFSVMGRPLLILPLITFLLGFVALRKWTGATPVGMRPARLGIVLAAGFGMCGLMLPWFKTSTLGTQAEQFSRDYMEVVAMGQDEFAMELNKDYINRFSETMSLQEHYHASERSQQALEEFRENSIHRMIRDRGRNAEWVLDRPTRIYYSYQRQHAEIVWMDPTGQTKGKILFILDYRVDSEGQGQWHIATAIPYRERIVAESVL